MFFSLSLFFFLPAPSFADFSSHRISSAEKDFFVSYEACGEKNSGKKILILPPTGGVNDLDRWYADDICENGGSAYILKDWSKMGEASLDSELHDRHLERSLRAFDLMREKIGGPVSLLGTSLGGLYGASMVARRDGIERVVLLVAGGPLSRVLAESQQEALLTLKQNRKASWNFSSDREYEALLGNAVSLDFLAPRFPQFRRSPPGSNGGASEGPRFRISPRNVMMVISSNDSTVPSASQESLWRALGKPKRIDSIANHFFTILSAYFLHSDEIVDFLLAN